MKQHVLVSGQFTGKITSVDGDEAFDGSLDLNGVLNLDLAQILATKIVSPTEAVVAAVIEDPEAAAAPTVGQTFPHVSVSSVTELVAAIKNHNNVRHMDGISRIVLTQNIISNDIELILQNINGLVIDGSSSRFSISRNRNQTLKSMVHVVSSDDVLFSNMKFDDTNDGKFGEIQKTKNMLWIRKSKNIKFDNVVVANSKGYAVYVRETDGFTFTNSELYNSGILGLYVGHGDDNQSKRVKITKNHFHDNATNAVAILGVGGPDINIIQHNKFERNHIYGRWPVAAKYGTGFTGGGQVYIAQVDNMLFDNNIIDDGKCLNGYHRVNGKTNGDVHGLELSLLSGDDIKVTRLTVSNNTITNNDGGGINQNLNSTLDHTTIIDSNNTITGNGAGGVRNEIKVRGATVRM